LVLVYIILLLICAQYAATQEPLFKKYTQDNGLPSLITYSILQDHKQFLWFCTSNGVCRFDGRHIKNYTPQNSLADYGAFRLFLDSKERLWVISIFSPPIYFKNEEFHFPEGIPSTSLLSTRAITEDSKGNLYFLSKKGTITKWHESNGFVAYNMPFATWSDGVMIHDSILIATDGTKIWKITNFIKKEVLMIDMFRHGEQTRLYKINANTVITSAEKGIYRITDKDYKLIWECTKDYSSDLYCFHVENDSTFWAGTKSGMYIYQYKNNKLTLLKRILAGKHINSILKDNNGNYWLAVVGDAIYFLNAANTIFYNFSELKNNISKVLFAGDKGYVFNSIGDYFLLQKNKAVYKGNFLSNDSKMIYLKSMKFSEKEILICFKNTSGFLGRHALRIEKDNWGVAYPNYYYRTDGIFFVGGNDIMNNGYDLVKAIKNGHIQRSITIPGIPLAKSFCVDLSYRCWAGYNDTIYCAEDIGSGKKGINKFFEKNVFISDIQCDGSNKIWVATKGGGVYCIKDKKKIAQYNTANGLLTNNCSSIYIDDSDNIWVCTENGLNEIMQYEKNVHNIRAFTKDNLLPDNGVNTVYRKGNTVYVGTCKGLVAFENKEVNTTASLPTPCYITNVAIKGRDTTLQDSYTIKYRNSISIAFSTIAYNNSRPPVYYYKLDRADADWNTTTSEKIQYEHLSSGNYVFYVYAGGWPNKGTSVNIIVLAPFWEKGWFIFLEVIVSFLLLTGILYLIIYFRNRKMELRRRMIENDLRSLRAQINPHFIFNALNSIQDFILKQEPRSANYYLSQFATLIRMIVDNSKKEYISLADEIEFLQLYLELEKLRLGSSFSFNIHYNKEIDPDAVSIPAMIIQPIAENCIAHGLPAKKGEKKLDIYFQQQGNLLLCTVTDNGVGRVYAGQHQLKKHKISMGITNITERLQLICAKENIKWQAVEITDLYNNGTAEGTKVSLFIPLNLN